ncbi:hypothetical protein HPULCUR_007327 [Helicostylum pulchrum]|uniref:Uncharacterized protein n=1 Tax=Helicostylum pulchrum TaxID=562976 RepID=A0ABP9Y4F9_9FUNG
MLVRHILLTISQLEFLSSNPVRCYCNKSAHRNYTLEYGPILECASYGNIKQDNYQVKYACGFHVHELSWLKLKQQMQSGSRISSHYSELRGCPLYNFTYQTVFNLENNFSRITPFMLPNCFCQIEVKLCDEFPFYFSCQNRGEEGITRCAWYLEAKNVAFIKTKHSLHTYVSLEAYESNYCIMKSVFEKRWLELEVKLNVHSFSSGGQTTLQNCFESEFAENKKELLLTIEKTFKTVERLARVRAELNRREEENGHITNK